ncbi:MAG: acyl-CoA/acyl-ACP dehydrogenase [Rhodospirillaceae bacterium]|jgi:acyl-CoA dehydrogenase|nr:acyl-CoA/acyl-ACP dehydrogenase [Rhodospirillaceae bacterium]MBT3782802.1 acyl-CoA/acyl-ACP dehydrogenase [Rhodospirillaceae bacterium]MBT3976529.1 acyl-CoA/acyl-ACP dehydrogenase [Rhodospirillaceae bacterium]MBT4170073.1 acyl-CoA/acyl-ACP dehydrogenase [Rhodospirillaceae bacterium]MBT4564720.1 acyl-CoA/acyl-ACP dehydrogenase [Rhodospirillaceae bacterium]
MDFELSDAQRMILDYGGKLAETFDRKQWLEYSRRHEFPEHIWRQMGEDGFLGMMVPEEYGGAGLGMFEMSLLMEGMSNHGIPMQHLVVGPTMCLAHIARHGTEEQKRRYLAPACAGKEVWCFAITEPTAGSNSMKITTLAKTADDGDFRLSGQKVFITGSDVAHYAMVVARTTPFQDAAKKTDGFTLFIVDLNAPGVTRRPMDMSIVIPERQCELFFDDVVLRQADVIGEVDKGFSILFDTLNPERIILASMLVGLGRYAITQAVEYASERQVFDAPIGSYQGLQHPLAEAKTEIEVATLMTYKAAWAYDSDRPAAEYSNMAKYYAAEAAIHAVDTAVQCFGGNAYTHEYGIFDLYPFVRMLRTAPLNREMLLNYIGEKVLGLPRSY